MQLSLIVPAYNEEKRLEPFLASLVAYYRTHQNNIQEIIVVDDGSSDATASIAKKYENQLPLHIIQHAANQGKGAAVRTGVMAAHAEYVVFMDADGATSITELPKIMTALHNNQIAIGNRWMTGAQTERHSLLRQFSGWANRRYMQLWGLGDIDTMCGFKGYQRNIAIALFKDLHEKRWLFDTEVAYRAKFRGYSIKNFPITWQSKDGSKLSTSTLIRSALQIHPLIRKIKKQEKTNFVFDK